MARHGAVLMVWIGVSVQHNTQRANSRGLAENMHFRSDHKKGKPSRTLSSPMAMRLRYPGVPHLYPTACVPALDPQAVAGINRQPFA